MRPYRSTEIIDAPVNIRGLKKFAVDQVRADKVPDVPAGTPAGKRVAVVGGGPSGGRALPALRLLWLRQHGRGAFLMPEISIKGKKLTVPESTTVLEAARSAGIDIPSLCYLKDVNDLGSCRLCMVEAESADRPLPACRTKELRAG